MSYKKTQNDNLTKSGKQYTRNDKFNKGIEIMKKNQANFGAEKYNEWNEKFNTDYLADLIKQKKE